MDVPVTKIAGCAAVNEHVGKPIPDRLWHYTSYAGFRGILSSKKIWATEYRFLNDREELLHAKNLAERLVLEEPESIGTFPAREDVKNALRIVFNAGPLHHEELRVMVASFSEQPDQLSQWRGYADDSRGVCIGLDLRRLRPPDDSGSGVTFAPCIYKQDEKCALLKGNLCPLQKEGPRLVGLYRRKGSQAARSEWSARSSTWSEVGRRAPSRIEGNHRGRIQASTI